MSDQLPMPVSAPLTRAQKTTIRNLIRRAARAEILPRFRKLDQGDIGTKTRFDDLVTAADTGAEAIIARGLQISFPNALVVGEEAAAKDPSLLDKIAEAELSFVIDPVDGTWNFANGLPLFGTMIAACRFGRPVYGLIYDPLGDDTMEADLDTPARHLLSTAVDRPLATAEPRPLGELKGYAWIGGLPRKGREILARAQIDLHGLSGIGCAAHEYRLLAQGAVDFVLAVKLTPWDHAAGVILCQKAGGHAAMLDGSDYTAEQQDGFVLSAASKEVWDVLADHFRDLLSENTEQEGSA